MDEIQPSSRGLEEQESITLAAVTIGKSEDELSQLAYLQEELAALRSADRQRQRTHTWLLIVILLLSVVGAGFGIGAYVVSKRGNNADDSCSPAAAISDSGAGELHGADGNGTLKQSEEAALSSSAANRCQLYGNEPVSPSELFGADDRLGAANYLQGLKLERLAKYLGPDAVAISLARKSHYDDPSLSRMCTSRVKVSSSSLDTTLWPCSSAFGTHLDGLGHAFKDGFFYNGIPISEEIETVYDVKNAFFSKEGEYEPPLEQQNRTVVHQQLKTLGLENVPPIATRGIVLNMLEVYGEDEKITSANGDVHLPAGFIITPEKVQEALELQGLQIQKGDVVLFHTGWEGALWLKDQAQYDSGEPGIGLDAAKYLNCHQVLAVGADTWAVEAFPTFGPRGFLGLQVHEEFLFKTGTHILENAQTQRLIEAGIQEFLFVLGLPQLGGLDQVFANPIALGMPSSSDA